MEVKVNLAGNEISIPVTPEQEAELTKKYEVQFMSNFFRETSREIRHQAFFTTEETDLLVDELFHAYPNPQELCESIIADNYFTQVKELADGIVEERVKYYRVTMRYEGEFEIVVKAPSEDEAYDYVNTLNHYDLCEHIVYDDIEAVVDDVMEVPDAEEYEVDYVVE